MKKLFVILSLMMAAAPAFAAEPAKECTLCVGTVGAVPMPQPIPQLVRVTEETVFETVPAEARRGLTAVVSFSVTDMTDAEARAKSIVEWAQRNGPFETLALAPQDGVPAIVAYAIKRVAVTAQGLNVARRTGIAVPTAQLQPLFENGAQPYFDVVVVSGAEVAATAVWLSEHDPSKKIFAVVQPVAPNPMYDLGRALADGATLAFADGTADPVALANLNRSLAGDFAYDSTAKNTVLDAKGGATSGRVLTFVRGEDLRSLLIPEGDAAATTIVQVPGGVFDKPRRIDAAGDRPITDAAKQPGRLLVGVQPARSPFAVTVERQEAAKSVTKEAIDVATQRGITVEEIIRNHQAYDAYQETIQPRYVALNTTKLRFIVAGGTDAVEASIAGEYFSDPAGTSDWVWRDFYINGVKWKYGRIPELPLIQPEKVTQLPLDIHLTNEYRYDLVRQTDLGGYRVYEVRFEPPPNAPAALPLYRGTVWIDSRTWARIRIAMVQMNLAGEVLSNEERVDFQPFGRQSRQVMTPADVATADGREIVWLPLEVSAQQVISAAGRANPIERNTTFTNITIEPPDYASRLQVASASDARMVRETERGIRYLEKRGDQRVVKEGFDTSQIFMLGGIHHDAGLEYPVVPLGGVDYFNFDLFNKGIQANVFFAGVVVAANATHPNVGNTRTNVGADFFGLAVPFENTMFRNGEERNDEGVKTVPVILTLRAGHPIFQFGKIDVSFTGGYLGYSEGQDTAADFQIPSSTFVFGPSVALQYARQGYNLTASYDYTARSSWEPWGNLAEYDEDQKTFTKYIFSASKSFFLPKFQRISVDLNYLDGQRLDRFSKYELGFFGSQRVHGIRSGSVRAERAFIGHLAYGFVLSDQFRIEGFYDHALVDDTTAGLAREPFQGVGIAGQTVGPYGTLLRLDIGKSIGRNAQDGFVANVVVLKLF